MLGEDLLTPIWEYPSITLEELEKVVLAGDLRELQFLHLQNPQLSLADQNNILLKLATEHGYQAIVNYLLEDEDVINHLADKSCRVLRVAIRHNQTDIALGFLKYPGIRDNITVDDNLLLSEATASGNIQIITALLGFEALKDNIAHNENQPLVMAASNGHDEVVSLLLNHNAVKENLTTKPIKKALFSALRQRYFRTVNRLLDESIIRHHIPKCNDFLEEVIDSGDMSLLKRCLNFQVIIRSVSANKNTALARAAKNGNLEMVNELLRLPEIRKNISHSNALKLAVRHSHLPIIKRLLNIDAFKMQLEHNPLKILTAAIDSNDEKILRYILAFKSVQDVLPFSANTLLISTIRHANASTFHCLLEHAIVTQQLDQIEKQGLLDACIEGGNVSILEYFLHDIRFQTHLFQQPPFVVLKKVAQHGHVTLFLKLLEYPYFSNTFEARGLRIIVNAIKRGHFEFVQFFTTISHIQQTLHNHDNKVLYSAINRGHVNIVEHLLKFPLVYQNIPDDLDQALLYMPASQLRPMLECLLSLPTFHLNVATNHNAIFHRAVRKGNLSAVKLLLTIEEVSSNITALNNYALKLAAKHNHLKILKLLLTYHEVVEQITADDNSAYRAAVNAGNYAIMHYLSQYDAVRNYAYSLSYIANFRENSMRALDSRQLDGLTTFKQTLEGAFQHRGEEVLMNELKAFLIEQYYNNPAYHQDLALPLQYPASLPPTAHIAYYQNMFHTVYRYLFLNPNPWLHPRALFTVVNEHNQPLTADIPRTQRELIAYIWLAITDESFPLPDDITRDDFKILLVKDLSLMARQHNWDLTRLNIHGEEEEYDDLEGDKPICSSGVAQSIAQILEMLLVNLGPQFKILNAGIIKRDFKTKLIAHHEKKGLFDHLMIFKPLELEQISEALDNLVIINCGEMAALEPEDQKTLEKITLAQEYIEDFVQHCQNVFGKERISAPACTRIQWAEHSFDTYEQLIRYLAKMTLSVFYSEIKEKINQLLNDPSNEISQGDMDPLANIFTTSTPFLPSFTIQENERPNANAQVTSTALSSKAQDYRI